MKKHPTKREGKRINDFLRGMEIMFAMQNHERHITYMSNDKDETVCEIKFQEDYHRAHLFIYPVFFTKSLKEQREFLLHEFCHYLTDQLYEVAYQLFHGKYYSNNHIKIQAERATSMTTMIIDKLLTGKMFEGTDAYSRYLKK